MKKLALFDFDGTLTTKDTLLEFLKFYRGSAGFYAGFLLLSPVMVLFKLKVIANWKAKETVLRFFLGNRELSDFQSACDQFASTVIPGLIRPEALARLHQHKAQGDEVIIVSASPENWIRQFSNGLNVRLIATRLEVADNKLTGKISGRNCFGPEKAVRVKELIDLTEYDMISAYGDSSGDKELLALAHKAYYRRFS